MKNLFNKKFILGLIFVAAIIIAMPVCAYANTTNWTAGINADFTNPGNWSNGVPVTGDTVVFDNPSKQFPTSGLPNSGQIFDIVFSDSAGGR